LNIALWRRDGRLMRIRKRARCAAITATWRLSLLANAELKPASLV
jgi:hypothetical protein